MFSNAFQSTFAFTLIGVRGVAKSATITRVGDETTNVPPAAAVHCLIKKKNGI